MIEYIKLNKDSFLREIPNFIKLYSKCFNGYISEELIKYRFIDNPFNDIVISAIKDRERIISTLCSIPLSINYKGEELKGAISLHAMTDPDYKGNGLFCKAGIKLMDYLKEDGYQFVYGFPNYLSNPAHIELLGYKDVEAIPTLSLDISNHISNDSRFINNNWDGLKSISDKGAYVIKDDEYLKWRYKNNPFISYLINKVDEENWAIFKEYENLINIVELHSNNRKILKEIIEDIITYAKKANKDKLTTWAPLNSEQHLALEKIGFRNNYPITYFAVNSFYNDSSLYNPNNWEIQMGDDLVY